MLGKRKAFRVRGTSSVKWTTVDMAQQGEAEVVNSSLSGLALLIYKDLDLGIGTQLFVEPMDRSTTIPHRKARIVWFKKTHEGGITRYHCGVEFIK